MLTKLVVDVDAQRLHEAVMSDDPYAVYRLYTTPGLPARDPQQGTLPGPLVLMEPDGFSHPSPRLVFNMFTDFSKQVKLGDMAVKKVLVGVDDEVWRKVRARAVEEGRTVGLVVENALKLYVGTPVDRAPDQTAAPLLTPEEVDRVRALLLSPVRLGQTVTVQPQIGPNTTKPTVEDLRALVETVKPESAREKAQRIAERQAWLRDHPEDETQ